MKEKYEYIGGQSDTGQASAQRRQRSQATNHLQMGAWLTITFMLVVIIISGVIMGLLYADNTNLHHRLNVLEGEMLVIRDLISQDSEADFERSRRNALYPNQYNAESPIKENYSEYSEDGVPVVSRKYKAYPRDRSGFRVYNAWYQHRRENRIRNDPRVVVKHATDAPIRPHHRKSASWSGGPADDEDDFLEFGESMYSDSIAKSKSAQRSNSIGYSRNRAKITNHQNYREENRRQRSTTPTPVLSTTSTTTTTTLAASKPTRPASLNAHMSAVNVGREKKTNSVRERGARNRMSVRNRAGTERNSARHIAAIHLEGDTAGEEGGEGGGRILVRDGVFRNWAVSRWARRMKMERKFSVKDGTIRITSPGIYFIYSQINYLDNHEVNSFQILVNNMPWVTCTTMTHTPSPTTKTNTCYTGGVRFLEQGDKIVIKNTDTNRHAVMLPSHSFFGAVQLSEVGL